MDHAVILFDGVCNLCNGLVQFVVRRDPAGYFRFASLGSAPALQVLGAAPVPEPLPDSVILVEGGAVFTRSTAALRIARRLTFPWHLAYAFVAVPRPLRDLMYDAVARYRYRWFGRRQSCMIPGPGLRERFL
jgi:predicted DCC family thiol-disulfide oxidoreductase YuxK